jgi:hypothetical protein
MTVNIENLRAMTDRKIVTVYDPPPFPHCHIDWAAFFDDAGEDSPVGYGPTEWDAIADLLNDQEILCAACNGEGRQHSPGRNGDPMDNGVPCEACSDWGSRS